MFFIKIVNSELSFKWIFMSSMLILISVINTGFLVIKRWLQTVHSDQLQLLKVDWEDFRKNKKENISKQHSKQQTASPIIAKQSFSKLSPSNARTDSPREDFAYVNNFLQDPKNRQPSSPSVRTIMTTATKVTKLLIYI